MSGSWVCSEYFSNGSDRRNNLLPDQQNCGNDASAPYRNAVEYVTGPLPKLPILKFLANFRDLIASEGAMRVRNGCTADHDLARGPIGCREADQMAAMTPTAPTPAKIRFRVENELSLASLLPIARLSMA